MKFYATGTKWKKLPKVLPRLKLCDIINEVCI